MKDSSAPLPGLGIRLWAALAAASLSWGVYRALTSSNDLMTRLREWHYLIDHWGELAGWRAPYWPLTYGMLTPLVWLPTWGARIVFLGINLGCLWYVWRRVSAMFELGERERWLWLALFGSWACVRVTLGSGQLGLICLAVVLWAFPFRRSGDAVRLGLSVVKHTLAYPIWLWLLWRRPRQLWATAFAAVVPFLAVLMFNPVPVNQFMQTTARATEKMVMQWEGGTSLLSAVRLTWPEWRGWHLVIAGLWVVMLVGLVRRVRDERVLLSALLLMSLWPFYHRPYDFVVAGPFLAVLVARHQWAWALALTVVALGWYERLDSLQFGHLAWLRVLAGWYYPVIILGCLGLAAWRLHGEPVPRSGSIAARANNG